MITQTETILDRIFAHKQAEVEKQKQAVPLAMLRSQAEKAARQTQPADFLSALQHPPGKGPALIAEIKRRSPSRGLLAPGLDPIDLARLYKANGAAAISVLTDERYFQGTLDDLQSVAQDPLIGLPVLRKDFIFDPYQLYQARLAGASAALLIVACLQTQQLADLMAQCQELDLTPLVEVHNSIELEVALGLEPALVGINNRDLHSFKVDLQTTLRLRSHIPSDILLVSESGIHTADDVKQLDEVGVDAILVGEALVTAPDRAAKVMELACYG